MKTHTVLSSIITINQNQHHDPLTNTNFDLTYLLPNLIVSSGPVDDFIHRRYRPNRFPEFKLFLDANHGEGNWKLYNLRAEKIGYQVEQLSLNMSHYPILDHELPNFDTILKVIDDLTLWLSSGPEKVAVLHCKAGKGRSGTLACCYMMFQDQEMTPNRANEIFTRARFVDGLLVGNYGVSILSQRRYINYYYHYLNNEKLRLKIDHFNCNDVEVKVVGILLKNVGLKNITATVSHFQDSHLKTLYQWSSDDGTQVAFDNGHDLLFNEQPFSTGVKDLRFSFDHSILNTIPISSNFIWLNVILDLFGSRYIDKNNPNLEKKIVSDTNWVTFYHSKTFLWDQLDGFKGTYQRGIKLFESMELSFEISYSIEDDTLQYINSCDANLTSESHLRRILSTKRGKRWENII